MVKKTKRIQVEREPAFRVCTILPMLGLDVCPEVFGGSTSRPLLPGLPFRDSFSCSHAAFLGMFWSSFPVSTCRATPLTNLILLHCTSSVAFLHDLNTVQNSKCYLACGEKSSLLPPLGLQLPFPPCQYGQAMASEIF